MEYETDGVVKTGSAASLRKLNIQVVFTSIPGTAAALRAAMELASQAYAYVTLLIPENVPFALPIDRPQVKPKFLQERIHQLMKELPDDLRVRVLLCRDVTEALLRTLDPCSIVLIGGRERWWPTAERSLARTLERHCHHVVFVPLTKG